MPENNIKISIHDGTINVVDDSTKSAVKKAVDKINSTFSLCTFNNTHISIASDFSNLPDNGTATNNHLKTNEAFYSPTQGIANVDNGQKEIFIQETAHLKYKIRSLLSFNFSAEKEIEHTTLHEFGHLFDWEGGDKNVKQKYQELVNKYYDVQFEEIPLLPEEEKVMEEYFKNNGFSDKDDYKKALEKDFNILKLTNHITNTYGYILGEFYNRGLDVIPNLDDIEKAEASRMEIFAQLFSYALGGDDGCKEEFVNMFSNTYNVVVKYINLYKL